VAVEAPTRVLPYTSAVADFLDPEEVKYAVKYIDGLLQRGPTGAGNGPHAALRVILTALRDELQQIRTEDERAD